MNVKILEIIGSKELGVVVRFSCSAGIGLGCWKQVAELPVPGDCFSAELDVDELLAFPANLAWLQDGPSELRIALDEEHLTMRGRIESIDEDGMVYLRLADDCLVMIESSLDDIANEGWCEFTTRIANVVLVRI